MSRKVPVGVGARDLGRLCEAAGASGELRAAACASDALASAHIYLKFATCVRPDSAPVRPLASSYTRVASSPGRATLARTSQHAPRVRSPATCPACGHTRPLYRLGSSSRFRSSYARSVFERRWCTPSRRELRLGTRAHALPACAILFFGLL